MITHETVATGSDSADQVSVSHWNAGHVIVGLPLVTQIELSDEQLRVLASTHVEVVPAPGAGKFIHVISAVGYFKYGSAIFTTDDSNPTLGYGNGYNVFNGSFLVAGLFDDAITPLDLSTGSSWIPSEMVDKALNVEAVGDLDDGTGGALKVTVVYVIVETP